MSKQLKLMLLEGTKEFHHKRLGSCTIRKHLCYDCTPEMVGQIRRFMNAHDP